MLVRCMHTERGDEYIVEISSTTFTLQPLTCSPARSRMLPGPTLLRSLYQHSDRYVRYQLSQRRRHILLHCTHSIAPSVNPPSLMSVVPLLEKINGNTYRPFPAASTPLC